MNKIVDDCYIVFSEYGVERMTKRQGSLKAGEVSIRIRLSIPESAFQEPAIAAFVEASEEHLNRPEIIATIGED